MEYLQITNIRDSNGGSILGILRKTTQAFRKNPIIWSALKFRNWAYYRSFRASGAARGRSFSAELAGTGRSNFCFVVAFNTPWVIDALSKGWALYASDMTLVVIDNSSEPTARKTINAICRQHGVPYFPLPRNREANANRSHGTAMNWIFHNIVKSLRPHIFGFIDHDCLPIAPVNIPARMEGKIGYGLRCLSTSTYVFNRAVNDPGWYLWAGLCFFNFAEAEVLEMDFRNRLESGMDTGGGNWPLLYSKTSSSGIELAVESRIPISVGGTTIDYQLFDGNLFHVGGASYQGRMKQPDYRRLLSNHIWDAYLGGSEGRVAEANS